MKEDILSIKGKELAGSWEDDDYFDDLDGMEYVTTHKFLKTLDKPLGADVLKQLDKLIEDNFDEITLNGENLVESYEYMDTCEDFDGNEEEFLRETIRYDGLDIKNNTLRIKFHSGTLVY